MAATPTAPPFESVLHARGVRLDRADVRVLQVNVGFRCNLACHHCHVEAGPKRTEAIDRRIADRVLFLLERNPFVEVLDLTGGAPELHPEFERLVRGARELGRRVIDRCNLTVFFEPGQEKTPEFLAEQGAEIVASLPCYTAENVDQQRGRGVFGQSIDALLRLNALGYGQPGSGRVLDLVYNPLGASLPPGQPELEAQYREELRSLFGIEFNHLLTITNMPIKRFADALRRRGEHAAYLQLLVESFNPSTLPGLMCRETLSIGYDGRLYDCDFNQMLELPLGAAPERTLSVFDVEDLRALRGTGVTTDVHCFGCTAGAGSSCGGAIKA